MTGVSDVSKDDFSNVILENSAIQFVVVANGTTPIKKSELSSYGVNMTI